MYMYTTKVTIHRKTEIGKYPKNTLQQRTNLCNCQETMKRNSPLSVPLSLVFTRPQPQLHFHFIINDYNNLTRTKVCKNIAIVAPLVLCADNVCKVLLMVCDNLFPVLREGSLFWEIINLFQSIFYTFPDHMKCICVVRILVVVFGTMTQSIIQTQLSTSRMPLQLNQKRK